MLARKRTRRGVIGAAVLAGILAVGGYALTNALTFTDASSTAGDANQTVTVENVDNIHYNLNSTTPTNIDSVVVTLTTALKMTQPGGSVPAVWIQPDDTNATVGWYGPPDCTIDVTGKIATCTTNGSGTNTHQLTTSEVGSTTDHFHVVAAD